MTSSSVHAYSRRRGSTTKAVRSRKNEVSRDSMHAKEEPAPERPNLRELRRIRAAYFGRPHSERVKVIRPKSQTTTSARPRSTVADDRKRKTRKHGSTSSQVRKTTSESHRRREDLVYVSRSTVGSRETRQRRSKLDEERVDDDQSKADSGAERVRTPVEYTDGLPTVPESEIGPDDSISVIAERQISSSHRATLKSRPSARRRSTASARLEPSIVEDTRDASSRSSARRSSRRDSSLLDHIQRRHSTSSIPAPPRLVDCLTCGSDDIPSAQSAKLACSHRMCHDCLKRVFEMSVKDPAHMPPKCCTDDHIPLKHVEKLFDLKFKMLWNRKYQEYNTKNRIYCPARNCGAWIKPSHIHTHQGRKYAQCPRCKTNVCTTCNNKMHKSRDCPQDPEIAKLVQQAKEKGWQRCFSCNAMVELKEGCNHMTCRCTAEFCMMCGSKWKTCECPWFNYANLPDPDRLNEMRVPEPIQIIFRRVFDATRPQPPPPPPPPLRQANEEPRRDRTYAQEMEQRRRQERLDGDLARRMQLASIMDPGDPLPRNRPRMDLWGIGNAAEHLLNEDFVQNAANVVMDAFGDAEFGRRGERSSGRRRHASRQDRRGEVGGGLVPNFLGDERVLGVGPAPRLNRATL